MADKVAVERKPMLAAMPQQPESMPKKRAGGFGKKKE
jgi:hypothetical protein